MVIRMILRYLANNEQLVQRLSESYVMRRAAQMMVSAFYRTKSFAEEQRITDLTPERFRSFMRAFKNNVKAEIEDAKKDLRNKK